MQSKTTLYTDTDGATVTMDFNVSQTHRVTVAGNRTLVFSNAVAGEEYAVMITQDATGSRTITWPATVKWAGGSAPTLTTTASRTDIVYFFYDGTNFLDKAIKLNHNIA